jgi:peptidoglycan/LPS O-acetylase OafA/YrhL
VDGLRAIAVLSVIFHHAGFKAFSGGFVGVDVFFVISGYLITAIIMREYESGTFSALRFYERRMRRIVPALLAMIVGCIPLALMWLSASELREFAQSLVGIAASASNIYFWRESGYFATANELRPMLHTWSLAVEEQFYLLYPLLLGLHLICVLR